MFMSKGGDTMFSLWKRCAGYFDNYFQCFFAVLFITQIIAVTYMIAKTPEAPNYAVNSVIIAVNEHDTKTFTKYLDLDSTLSNIYDSLDDKTLGKEEFIAVHKEQILHFVQTGLWGSQKYDYQQEILEALDGIWLKNSLLHVLKSYDVAVNDGFADLAFNIYDKRTNKDITLFLKLEKTACDYWQVKEISNFNDFISGKGSKYFQFKSINGFTLSKTFHKE